MYALGGFAKHRSHANAQASAGMSCFVESAGCLDCFVVPPRNDAKRQWDEARRVLYKKLYAWICHIQAG